MHDASVGARGKARQVSDLFDGLSAGHEKERGRSAVVGEARRHEGKQIEEKTIKAETEILGIVNSKMK